MDDYTAAKLADMLGIDAMEIIAAANIEREKEDKRKEYWRNIYGRITAACLVATISTPSFNSLETLKNDRLYIMRIRRRILDRGKGSFSSSYHKRTRKHEPNKTKTPFRFLETSTSNRTG